jgi:hypothetical protein
MPGSDEVLPRMLPITSHDGAGTADFTSQAEERWNRGLKTDPTRLIKAWKA